jgi:hypothetical protein
MGVGVRACVQCGLSIGETAAFCPVCGARFDLDAAVVTLEATQVVEGPQAGPSGESGTDRWSDAQPYEPGAELVADLGAAPLPAGDTDLDADVGSRSKAEPADEAGPEPALVDTAEPEPADEAGPEPAQPELTGRDRKLAAIAVLLEAASGCEDGDMSRAAALYQEAILGCLDAAGDADGFGGVDQVLLHGFDGLSSLLARKGLAGEALGVVDDAAALGLLNGGDCAADVHRDALRERREDLRRSLFADSAQL